MYTQPRLLQICEQSGTETRSLQWRNKLAARPNVLLPNIWCSSRGTPLACYVTEHLFKKFDDMHAPVNKIVAWLIAANACMYRV